MVGFLLDGLVKMFAVVLIRGWSLTPDFGLESELESPCLTPGTYYSSMYMEPSTVALCGFGQCTVLPVMLPQACLIFVAARV